LIGLWGRQSVRHLRASLGCIDEKAATFVVGAG
jgi:hypothetical protein